MRAAAGALLACVAILPVAAAPNTFDLAKIAGVYKSRFDNATVEGTHFRSEDVLEIVPQPQGRAYLRVHLEFFNGHTCDAAGIADVRGDALVYDSYKMSNGTHCVLTLRAGHDRLTFADRDDICRTELCGARGVFSEAYFDRAARRPIRYMTRLLASTEFKGAQDEYAAAHRR